MVLVSLLLRRSLLLLDVLFSLREAFKRPLRVSRPTVWVMSNSTFWHDDDCVMYYEITSFTLVLQARIDVQQRFVGRFVSFPKNASVESL